MAFPLLVRESLLTDLPTHKISAHCFHLQPRSKNGVRRTMVRFASFACKVFRNPDMKYNKCWVLYS